MSQYYYSPPTENNFHGFNPFDEEAKRAREALFERKKKESKELRKFGIFFGTAIVLYLAIQVVCSMLLKEFDLIELYSTSSIFQTCFNILCISFLAVAVPFGIVALINKKHYKNPIIPNHTIKPSKCIAWVCFGLGSCICANFIVNFVITIFKNVLGLELTQSEVVAPTTLLECMFEFIGLAIIPAICEELAMRCCTLQLLRQYGAGFGIVTVSIVFGLLHGNVIQFLFAFIIGLVLAYVTIKTESIIPALLIHGLNNGMSAVQDTVGLYAGDKTKDYVTAGLFIFWIITGIISAIYLFIKKDFKGKLDKGSTVLATGEKIKAFFLPGMVVPFALLIVLTLTTIKKI